MVCNHVLQEDLLGKGEANSSFLQDEVGLKELNKDNVKNSHLLEVNNVARVIIAYLFRIYPDNVFSRSDQVKLIENKKAGSEPDKKVVNNELLKKALEDIGNGEYLKLEVINKTGLKFNGHSLLIKKESENSFMFFDPNTGEKRGLKIKNLEYEINNQIERINATDLLFINGNKYIEKLKKKKIITLNNIASNRFSS